MHGLARRSVAIAAHAHRLRPVGREAESDAFFKVFSHRPQPVGVGGKGRKR